jgi:uncharacterized protein (UPF0303 family)
MESMENVDRDLAAIRRQEAQLVLPSLYAEDSWALGTIVRNLALERSLVVAIDVRRFGQPSQQLFYAAMQGTTPDNGRWIARKSNVVARFHRSSYQVGLHLGLGGMSFSEKYALPDDEYATHGGSFPLHVAGVGVVGSLTVSGLPQRADHELAVEALCVHLCRDYDDLRLSLDV